MRHVLDETTVALWFQMQSFRWRHRLISEHNSGPLVTEQLLDYFLHRERLAESQLRFLLSIRKQARAALRGTL